MFSYSMPTQLFSGELTFFQAEFDGFGKKACIITGKSSAKNGALDDVASVLQALKIAYCVFDEIEENPSIETAEKAARLAIAETADFIIGIGGGSPLDAAKAVAVLAASPDKQGIHLFSETRLPALPLILVPTTAGTGSETTPYAILTDHTLQTKVSMSQPVFARKAFLDSRYTHSLPESVTLSTAIDTLTHFIEGYTAASANFLSDTLAQSGLTAFGTCIPALTKRAFTPDLRERLLHISALGGMVIAQTKTTLPHQLGYALSYHKKIPHGFACGILTVAYLKLYKNREKVRNILTCLNIPDLNTLDAFLRDAAKIKPCLSHEEARAYTQEAFANKAKLKNCPFTVQPDDLALLYADVTI